MTDNPTEIVIHCQPDVSDEVDGIGLIVTYAELTIPVTEWLTTWEWTEKKTIVGPQGYPISFYIQKYKDGAGPVFIEDLAVFTPFAIAGGNDETFHCINCGRIIMQWLGEQQHEWAKEHHNDWYKSVSEGNPSSKRLH